MYRGIDHSDISRILERFLYETTRLKVSVSILIFVAGHLKQNMKTDFFCQKTKL